MDNKDILLLKTLYEEKNITHTAKRLFLSQPALTDRLKRLEAEFGCTLFLRQPRGIQFTSEGCSGAGVRTLSLPPCRHPLWQSSLHA